MAIAHQSTNNSGWSTGTSSVVTKPTGLAVGDLMIAFYFVQSISSQALPSGFTTIDNTGTLLLGFKVATSGDVAATDFTFTNGSTRQFASISRITGSAGIASLIAFNEGTQNNTATPSIAAGVTPPDTRANSLIMMFWNQDTNASVTGSYAIATSNPSWSEGFDVVDGTTFTCAMAHAVRPQTTATGNVSAAGGDASTDWILQIIAIAPALEFGGADTTTLTEASIESLTQNTSETITLTETIDFDDNIMWTNQDKSTSTWINIDKS